MKSLGQQRDDHGEQTGGQRADHGNERTEEDERRQGQRQRDAHDGEPRTDGHRVDQCDQRGGPRVARQGVEPGGAGFAYPGAVVLGNDLGYEPPDAAATQQEEDHGEQQKQCTGEDFDESPGRRESSGGQLVLMGAQGVGERVDGPVDLVAAEFRGAR